MSTFIRLILDGPAFIVNDVVDDEGDGPPSKILSSFIAILAATPYSLAPRCPHYPRCSLLSGACVFSLWSDSLGTSDIRVGIEGS